MKSYSYYGQTLAIASNQPVPPAMTTSDVWLGCCILTLPMLVVFTILGYRRHHARTLKLRILHLEKMWNLSAGQDSITE